jgi:hypothetical protein
MRNAICRALSVFAGILIIAGAPQSSAETIVNNFLSPFTTIKIIGSRPGPRPQWAPECNQGFTEWKPVCAVTLNRVAVTYPNHCMAQLDNAFIIDNKPCPIAASCAPTYEPVCGRPQRRRHIEDLTDALAPPKIRHFINECFARAQSVVRLSRESPPGLWEDHYGDVTILRRYGDDLYQYPNGLRYQYYGRSGLEDYADVCPKTCPEGGLVVCAVDHNNIPRLYKNRCSAVLAGADPTRFRVGDIKSCK